MFRTNKPICIFVLAIFGLVLIASVPAGAQGLADITKVTLTDKESPNKSITTEIDGISPQNPEYTDGTVTKEMKLATEVYICPDNPTVSDGEYELKYCRKAITATFGAAWNTWVCWGGRWFYIAP